jgi:hypothetical protein
MKIASLIARYLLGFIFLVFGLNGFLHFIPAVLPPGVAGQYLMALSATHYMTVIFVIQLSSAILLLLNRYVALALVLLAPVIVNILLFHVFMAPSGLPIAVVVAVLWGLTAWGVRSAFTGLLRQQA